MNTVDEILKYLYQLRVLSYQQIEQYFFDSKHYCEKLIRKMTNDFQYIKKVKVGAISYYMITNKGIYRLKKTGSSPLGGGKVPKLLADEYLTERMINLKTEKIPHQIALNEMVLRFGQVHYPVNWIYMDDKFANQNFTRFQPDGMLEVEDICYLIEMDMNTERIRQLSRKWERYRNVVEKGIDQKYRKIRVLFTLGTDMDYEKRKEQLYKSIQYYLAEYIHSGRFDVYAGTVDEMLEVMDREITDTYISDLEDSFEQNAKNMSFCVERNKALGDREMDFFLSLKNRDGGIAQINEQRLEYLVTDFRHGQYSAVSDILFFGDVQVACAREYGRNIKMIVLLKNDSYNPTIAEAVLYEENIFLTTEERWENMTFPESLFRWERDRTRYHLTKDMKTLKQE